MNRPITIFLTMSWALALTFAGGPALAAPVIVQLDKAPAARYVAEEHAAGRSVSDDALAAYRDELSADQDALLADMDSRGIGYTLATVAVPDHDGNVTSVDVRYTLVMNGIGLEVADGDLDTLRSMPQVRKVYADRMQHLHLDRSIDYIRAPEVYGQVAELTASDDLREGFEGQGMIISVIDTGIEWSHEMFGADATPPRIGLQPPLAAANNNEKVIYYLPLLDGVVDDFGHGTHASADAAGYRGFSPGPDGTPLTGDDLPIHGVAPQARLMGYKVCSGTGSAAGVFGCLTRSIILAIEDSVSPRTLTGFPKPVAHVINLSLGGAGGPDDATALAADNAALLGTIVVASAGNEGPGEGTVGSPAAGRHVIAVGANVDPGVFPNSITVPESAEVGEIVASKADDSNLGDDVTSPIVANYVFAGLADTPEQVPLSVLGNICLVQRGSTAIVADQGTGLFASKAANCESRGAIATVIFNNEPGPIGPILVASAEPVYTIARRDGETLLDLGFDASGVSDFEISLNPKNPALFGPTMAGFSSRGPVQGLGQVKPDVTAPGVSILSATSPVGVPVLSMQSETRYTSASGTSFSGPQVAGMAALIKQAHAGWTPDMVRTAMINTATNLRDGNGAPKADGPAADRILAQGGGLVDVAEAVNVRALMGVAGDGLNAPGILGSHSFGAVPVVNSRVTHSESVEATILDTSGDGGSYNLRVANNRDLEQDGIDVTLSTAGVAAGGSFTVNASIDGDTLRSTEVSSVSADGGSVSFETRPLQLQFYVVAERADGGETLRMPFYLKPTASIPAEIQRSETTTHEDVMPAGDTNLQLAEDITYKDFPVETSAATFRLRGELSFDDLAGGLPDLDLFLLDEDGEVIAESANAGGPESISYRPSGAESLTWRVTGWANAATGFRLDSIRDLGGEPPELAAFEGDFLGSDGRPVDFDGELTLNWTTHGNPEAIEVERSLNGGPFDTVAELDGGQTSVALGDQPEGELTFRMKALFPGQIGFFVSAPSNEEVVVVDKRRKKNITGTVESGISNVSFMDGIFAFDMSLTNTASQEYLPLVELNIIRIDSSSGTVEVANADNGGSGTSKQDPALFDYSQQLGDDDVFSAGETSGTRHLEFRDEAAELFTVKARVTGYRDTGIDGTAGGGGSASGNGPSGGGESGETDLLLELSVNPLTGSVTADIVETLL